ncbi:MAG TPA: flagellar protein FhlB [Acidiferrobacteraceae bacterium]|nr:flagellar protein FhlB [Acidiferrobacteraceae bacterium]
MKLYTPPSIAVALEYDGAGAPTVTAKGQRLVADKILELAKKHDIPLYEDPALVTLLSKVELGDEIPRALYTAVAEVIAFAYMVSGKVTSRGLPRRD